MSLADANQLVLVRPGGTPRMLLTAADGLSTPVDVKLGPDGTLYVADGAYITHTDPNLLAVGFVTEGDHRGIWMRPIWRPPPGPYAAGTGT